MRTSLPLAQLYRPEFGRRLGRLMLGFTASVLIAACSKDITSLDVPAPLQSVAHNAESLYDAARANKWDLALAELDTLKRGAADLTRDASGSAVVMASLASEVSVLEAAVPSHDRAATLRSANEVTRVAAELTRAFEPSVPVEITLLDYSGRELELWAEAGDLAKLQSATETLRRTWSAIRGRVEKQSNGTAAAASFEGLVARAEAATTIGEYAAIATPILDEVDKLEQLFPKTDSPD